MEAQRCQLCGRQGHPDRPAPPHGTTTVTLFNSGEPVEKEIHIAEPVDGIVQSIDLSGVVKARAEQVRKRLPEDGTLVEPAGLIRGVLAIAQEV